MKIVAAAQDRVVSRHPEEAESDHKHAGNRSALEGNVKRRADPVSRRFSRADVCTHRHVHPDKTGRT